MNAMAKKIYGEVGEASLTNLQKVALLCEGVVERLLVARENRANKQKCDEQLQKAFNIIDIGLLANLDFEKGGEIAKNLCSIYLTSLRAILKLRFEWDEVELNKVIVIFSGMGDSWRKISK